VTDHLKEWTAQCIRLGRPARRPGVTLLEMLIVLAILGTLMALLLPALGGAYRRANEAVCRNNLHQMTLALAEYRNIQKRIPLPAKPGTVGGWAVELLPYLEQGNLFATLKPDTPLSGASQAFLSRPRIMRCPMANPGGGGATMEDSSYVLVVDRSRRGGVVFDMPLGVQKPWASSPEMSQGELQSKKGPHQDKFFGGNEAVFP
jgi:prepilin-type N-terminal cleavage/methylation domain-containing protein